MSFFLLVTSSQWDMSDGYWVTSFLGVALFVMISLTFWRVLKRWCLENSINIVRESRESRDGSEALLGAGRPSA